MRFARTHRAGGFTLVELLVVIGIIALLISILLPALTAARRQANAVKCAAALREIGNAIFMYAHDNKGYAPPARVNLTAAYPYEIDGHTYTHNLFMPAFIAKYVTKGKQGVASTTDAEAADVRRSVLWGCPSWDGYASPTLGGVNRAQQGYGMNYRPTYSANHPSAANPFGPNEIHDITPNKPNPYATGNYAGTWYKLKAWTQPAERMLMGDSLFWAATASVVPADGTLQGQQLMNNSGAVFAGVGNTSVDAYRHGVYPPRISADQHSPIGGKVAFNILYADGHVVTSNDRTEAFRSIRMKFPG